MRWNHLLFFWNNILGIPQLQNLLTVLLQLSLPLLNPLLILLDFYLGVEVLFGRVLFLLLVKNERVVDGLEEVSDRTHGLGGLPQLVQIQFSIFNVVADFLNGVRL